MAHPSPAQTPDRGNREAASDVHDRAGRGSGSEGTARASARKGPSGAQARARGDAGAIEQLAPDFIEPVVGWRSWAVVQHRRQLRLRSVVFDTIWPAQEELIAECNRLSIRLRLPYLRRRATTHAVPLDRCSCGIHATKHRQTAANYLYLYEDVRQPQLRYRAIGRVSLWGSVVEGDDGWRASRAYPERLFLPATDRSGRPADLEPILEGLSDYGVPIEILQDDAETALASAVRRVKQDRRRRQRGTKAGS